MGHGAWGMGDEGVWEDVGGGEDGEALILFPPSPHLPTLPTLPHLLLTLTTHHMVYFIALC